MYLHQGILCTQSQQTNHCWRMDRGMSISWHVHLMSHTHTRMLAFTEFLFNPSFFHPYEDWRIHTAIIQHKLCMVSPTLRYFTGCLLKHIGSYYTDFFPNKNVSQSSHIVQVCFYFAAIKHSPKLLWDRKGLFYFRGSSPPLKKARTETQAWYPEARTEAATMEKCCLPACFLRLYQLHV